MSTIYWPPQLQPHEYPAGVLDQMNPQLFNEVIIPLRLEAGVPFTPSPLPEGHVRNKGTSRHSTQGGQRLSDASDTFIPSTQAAVAKVIRKALSISKLGGFGVYFDTSPSVMIHTDMRPERLMWIRVEGDYIYEVNDPVFFYAELSRQLEGLKVG